MKAPRWNASCPDGHGMMWEASGSTAYEAALGAVLWARPSTPQNAEAFDGTGRSVVFNARREGGRFVVQEITG